MSKYFVAIVVYKATSSNRNDAPMFEESIILIKASNNIDAKNKVNSVVKNRETSYKNEEHSTISWNLLKIVDINEMIDESINDVTEIYSRHFTDIESYRKFDQLAEG